MERHWYEAGAIPVFRHLELAAHAVLSRKGEGLVALDLRGISDVTDFFLIASGGSDVHVGALYEGVVEELAAVGLRPLHAEGIDRRRWILLDYVDLVVHLMLPAAREYYRLEELWNDAPRLEIGPDYFRMPAVRERHPGLTLTRLGGASAGEET